MAIIDRNDIKQWFLTNLKPTQTQFWNLLDSYRHKNEKIPAVDVDGLANLLNDKVDKIAGFGLSKNDFTDILKLKLEAISMPKNIDISSNFTAISSQNDYEITVLGDVTVTLNDNLMDNFRLSLQTMGGILTVVADQNCNLRKQDGTIVTQIVLQDGKSLTIGKKDGTNVFNIIGDID